MTQPLALSPSPPAEFSPDASPEPAFWHQELHRVPWCVELKRQADTIRSEIFDLIGKFRPFMPYPKYPVPHYPSLYDNTWDAFPVSIFEGEHIELSKAKTTLDIEPLVRMFRSKLPTVTRMVADLEREGVIRNVFVSRLIPGSIIHPHRGWTPDYLRIHLCLQADPDCHITVGAESRTWVRGELLAFKDGGPYPHSVEHKGSSERIIISHDLRLSYLADFIPELLAGGRAETR